jgi:glycine hydroxymethyltransferase
MDTFTKEISGMMTITDWHGGAFRLGIATDHGGMTLKESLVAGLKAKGIAVTDCGAHVCDPADDYPDFGASLAGAVARGELDCGILLCRSGVGMGIVANRFHGVRAAVASTPEMAKASRNHNASNVLVIAADYLSEEKIDGIVAAWLETPFGNDPRHVRRLVKIENQTYDEIAAVRHADPEIAHMLDAEKHRQDDGLELIASENFASAAIRAAQGTVLTNKYAEGYPGKRYYNGCEVVDEVESLAIQRACKLFGAEAANVQAHAGSQANMAAYFALIAPGDTVLAMSLDHGGHLTHGHPINFSGMLYKFIGYGVRRDTEVIDYDEVERLAQEHRPKLVVAGASAYPRTLDFPRLRAIADGVGAKLMVDMAHIAGLVAAGLHPSPIPYSDVVTTTTHKTLRGPRSGLILCREAYAKAINSKVFPGLQGGPLMHTIAAKAICFREAMQPAFKAYQAQVLANAKTLAAALTGHGFRIVSGGTDNHLMLVDLRPKGATGKDVSTALDKAAITVNKNMIPFDPEKPFVASGIRIGTPAVTTRGMKEAEMKRIAEWIARAVDVRADDAKLAAIAAEVRAFTRAFPLPQFGG